MSLSAAVVRELIDAGLSGEALMAACERIEARDIQVAADPVAEKRRAYDRERKAAKALAKRLGSTGIPPESAESTGTKEVPHTPPENPSPKEKPLRGKKKAVSLPDDFRPDLDWAMAQGLSRAQAEAQAASFCDFWRGAKDGEKADWPATWRNRVRNFIEKHGITPRATTPDTARAPEELEKHWLGRLEYGRVHGKWLSEQWGPAPGTEGCRVPPKLLKPGDGEGWRKWESAA